jgi:hypothetical protein
MCVGNLPHTAVQVVRQIIKEVYANHVYASALLPYCIPAHESVAFSVAKKYFGALHLYYLRNYSNYKAVGALHLCNPKIIW